MRIKWKTIAIIFIVLFLGLVSFVTWALWDVDEENDNYLTCRYITCPKYIDGDLWYEYQPDTRTCNCYNESKDLVHSEIMKSK